MGGAPHTEDKRAWCAEGVARERLFVDKVAPFLSLPATINPAKARDRYAPDLLVTGKLADLKCQWTPFFRAADLYGFDPQWTVTFNRKDYDRYSELYPEIGVYFWVRWTDPAMTIRGRRYSVLPMRGVWQTTLADLQEIVEGDCAPLHTYERRRDDQLGNARDSYIFNLREFNELAFGWL